MPKVTVITPISHDGVLYEPGETLECTAKQAKTLCDLGSARMAEKAKEAEPAETETTEPASSAPAAPKPKPARSRTRGK